MTLRSPLLPASLLAAALALAACASVGSADLDRATDLWTEMAGYRGWGSFPGRAGFQPGKSPHGRFIRVTLNDVAAADPEGLPPGSIVVKENFSREDAGTLRNVTVMKRVEGFRPEDGDWFWAVYNAEGRAQDAGAIRMCIDCHFDAGGDDYVFLND